MKTTNTAWSSLANWYKNNRQMSANQQSEVMRKMKRDWLI